MSDQTRNRAGFLLSDTRALHWLHEQCLSHISQMSGHDEKAIIRRTRVLAHWLTATVEAALCETDAETEALDMLDSDLQRFFAERKAGGDAVDR
jgi:hypothetical protein